MDAFADRARLVLCFAGFAGHASTPGQGAGPSPRREKGIDTVPGFGRWTVTLDAFAMSPVDVLAATEPPSTIWRRGKRFSRARVRSSIGRIRPRSDSLLSTSIATRISLPAALATCTL